MLRNRLEMQQIPTKSADFPIWDDMGKKCVCVIICWNGCNLFGNAFRKNLRLLKPCAVIIGTKWLKYNINLIWECARATPEFQGSHWPSTPYRECVSCHHLARPMQDLTLFLVPAMYVRVSTTTWGGYR